MEVKVIRLDGCVNPFVNQLQNDINALIYSDKYRLTMHSAEFVGLLETIKWDIMNNGS